MSPLKAILKKTEVKNLTVIMNPPYGKASSLSRKILNTILTNKFQQVICLAPVKTNFDNWENMGEIKGPFGLSNLFEISESHNLNLWVSSYTPTSKNTKTFMEVVLNKQQLAYYKAVERYNQVHTCNCVYLKEIILKNKEKYKEYQEDLIFEVPIYTPSNGVQLKGASAEHNLKGKPIQWKNEVAENGVYFNTKQELNNFSNWYYSNPYSWSNKRKDLKHVMDVCLSILLHHGPGPSIVRYIQVWPNLDWTKSWTDEKIIQELKDEAGLSKDWALT